MSGAFVETPALIKLSEPSSLGRARWRTQSELIYRTTAGSLWIVPSGYVTDFASVPRIPLAYWLTGDSAHMSAVLHDWLCTELYPEHMTWAEAADTFREAMAAEGVPAWRRWIMYWAVRLFGETKD
jgi:hypothetical protein